MRGTISLRMQPPDINSTRARDDTRPLSARDTACLICTLPECDEQSPACLYMAPSREKQRAKQRAYSARRRERNARIAAVAESIQRAHISAAVRGIRSTQ